MIVHNVKQGSLEWQELRLGIPTASNFHRIVTPATCDLSVSCAPYAWHLIAERLLGYPIESPTTALMDRGSALEAEAVKWYEFDRDADAVKVGFMTTDDGRIGASPDRLVGDDGLLEVKCPQANNHVGYVLGGLGTFDSEAWERPKKGASVEAILRARILAGQQCSTDYWPQIQGQMWISERRWCDILSYHPGLTSSVLRVSRDDAYIAKLSRAVEAFADCVDAAYRMLAPERTAMSRRPAQAPLADWLGVSDADLQAILAGQARRAEGAA